VTNNRSKRYLIDSSEKYVSRSAYKLDSVVDKFNLDFKLKTVLDVGSSSGGFSDYALSHGASYVIAVEKGTNQMNPRLKLKANLELHEKTDIRDFVPPRPVDIVLIDVSFLSIKVVLSYLLKILDNRIKIVAMVKPQFETSNDKYKHLGVVKNESIRRSLLLELENWLVQYFIIDNKADSKITGLKGNRERFYLLHMKK